MDTNETGHNLKFDKNLWPGWNLDNDHSIYASNIYRDSSPFTRDTFLRTAGFRYWGIYQYLYVESCLFTPLREIELSLCVRIILGKKCSQCTPNPTSDRNPGPIVFTFHDNLHTTSWFLVGEFISPERIEGIFCSNSNYIKQMFVYGESLWNSPVCVVVPNKDYVIVSALAISHPELSYSQLCSTAGLLDSQMMEEVSRLTSFTITTHNTS